MYCVAKHYNVVELLNSNLFNIMVDAYIYDYNMLYIITTWLVKNCIESRIFP